ncbi:major facilitator superfamily domain-containing protein [Aspergillus pseudonomiae]|uniref:Major facilitator superfamily domain-containing protein n=1 Tax=Aspergillus pseudonomiae TaxID=1506151 RepID=A0A5N6I6N0_9EURO|nr:major facilitator superfamily domain-containing protein [Aspergillus pseudonomiae]KAB8261844.1 major facilitator superfamily domain-containing protein [Aspergillus pseudonomiae]KAE8403324.1 major facilitator superfamily domain-containing protein [Aspergillus pseudonomiae]
MQSFRQYRSMRRDLQESIKLHGPYAAAGDRHVQPTDDILEDADDARLEKGIHSMDGHGQSPYSTPGIVLHDGQKVTVPGVNLRRASEICERVNTKTLFIVGFDGPDDKLNPKNWSIGRKWATLGIVGTTGMLVGWASSIDSTVIKQGQEAFGVSEVAESLATALFLIAFGFGSLVAAPFSETVGRNPVYIATLSILMIFTMASGLAPNFGAQLAFRFLAGLFGCTPMTTFGGSMADIFDPMDRTYAFPVCCTLSFLGPFLAPMVGAFIGQSTHISWRWTEWATLIMAALVTGAIFLFVPETYGPVLLQWKAKHLREITGDQRFMAEIELRQTSLVTRLMHSCSRPFHLFFREIMVALFTMYLVVVYIVLFGFLTGYEFIFGRTYGFTQGSVGLTFIGMNIGFLIAFAMVPHIYFSYKKRLLNAIENGHNGLPPEERLWFAMYGAPWLPISLFWMGWTSYPSISYWSPLVASVAFGFSVQGIFISTYQYLIDTYELFAASALVSATFFRYIAAGAMVIVSIPMYGNLGVHWSLTLLGCISVLMTPVPYIFYKYGHVIRQRNKKTP